MRSAFVGIWGLNPASRIFADIMVNGKNRLFGETVEDVAFAVDDLTRLLAILLKIVRFVLLLAHALIRALR